MDINERNNKKELNELEITEKDKLEELERILNFLAIKNRFWRGKIILEK